MADGTFRCTVTACKDCGSSGVGWWVDRFKSNPGAAAVRCEPCYLAYTRARYERKVGRPVAARPNGRGSRVPGGVPPRGASTISCSDCGILFRRSGNPTTRCPECVIAHSRKIRSLAEHRRRLATNQGDAGIDWRSVGERDNWKCHLCGLAVVHQAGTAHVPLGATVDHLVPIAANGEHRWTNVALAHRRCNLSRGTNGVAQLRLVG